MDFFILWAWYICRGMSHLVRSTGGGESQNRKRYVINESVMKLGGILER